MNTSLNICTHRQFFGPQAFMSASIQCILQCYKMWPMTIGSIINSMYIVHINIALQ